MTFPRTWPLALGAALLSAALGPSRPAGSVDETIERGRYLTPDLATSVQCHTPRDDSGALRMDHFFEGAPVPVPAPHFQGEWATTAPNIAGLYGFTDRQVIELLMRGQAEGRRK